MEALNRIVAQEPQSVAQLFNLFGYQMPATARNLENLVKVYGKIPLPISNATGDDKPKKTFAEIMGMVANGVQTLASVISAVKGTSPIAQSNGTNVRIDGSSPVQTERVFGIDRNIFIVLALLTVIVVGLLIFRKK